MDRPALVVAAVAVPFVLVLAAGSIESRASSADSKSPVVSGGPPTPFIALPWAPTGTAEEQYFGHSVVPAGDVDNDGDGDILVGSFSFDSLLVDAHLFLGSPQGVSTTPSWTYESGKRGPRSVAPAGDVNGDGYADVVLGFPEWNLPNKPLAGRVAVFHGGPNGLPATPTYTLSAPGAPANEQFGWAVAPAGDVNGDNFADVIVGGIFHSEGGFNQRGAAYIFHGSAAGLGAAPARTLLGPAQNGSNYGHSIATAGDVNADGFADILVGAPNANGNGGLAELHLGSASGVLAVADTVLQGTTSNELFGWGVATAGDVNGDDYADVLISAEGFNTATGYARLYFGGPQGIASAITLTSPQAVQHDHFGYAVSTLGDIDGDLFAEFAVSAVDPPGNRGRVSVYRGGLSGPTYMGEIFPPDPLTAGNFGQSVVSSGDVNSDGFTEILIGDPFAGAVFGLGGAYLYVPPRTLPRSAPNWPRPGVQPGTGYGSALAIVPFRNGADFARLVIGDPGYDGSGRITFHLGLPPVGVSTQVEDSHGIGAQGEKYGARIADVGDFDRNGFSDFIVSSPDKDNGLVSQAGRVELFPGALSPPLPQFVLAGDRDFDRVGSALAGRGDVNGDGFHDFVVGAREWDSALELDCGKAWLFLGNAGPPGAPAWSRQGVQYQGLGASVAMGDVDADGYSDVIVGSSTPPSGTPAPGKVEVFYGGPGGLSINPGLTLRTLGGEPSFGATVAAGDVTADGICDIIVGAPEQDSGVGRAFIYAGTRGRSQSQIPVWTNAGDGPLARYGAAIAAGGDIDGDGWGDLVIGEPGLDVIEEDGGLVDVYYGASPVPGLFESVTFNSEPPALGARLGESLAPLADVSADGFADIIAGAPGAAGRVYVFLGGGGQARRGSLALSDPAVAARRFHPSLVNDVDDVDLVMITRTAAGRSDVAFQSELRIHNEPFTGAPTATGTFTDQGGPGNPTLGASVHHSWPGRGLKVRSRFVVRSPYFQRTRWLRDGAHAGGDLDFRASGAVVDAGGTSEDAGIPRLVAVTPNPSRAQAGARLGFALPRAARVTLDVFDVRGARVRRLVDADVPAGQQGATWDGRDTRGRAVPPGLYFAVLQADGQESRTRLVRLP